MITKAKILQLPKGAYHNEQGKLVIDNKFKIYVPIFRRAGEPENNPSGASTMYATLCYNPGAENGYRVGDVVYISFENNQVGEPVILGKLFLNNTQESENSTYLIGDELNISKSAKLPIDTTIGDVKLSNIENLFQQVGVLYDNTVNLNDVVIPNLMDNETYDKFKTLPFLKDECLKTLNLLDPNLLSEFTYYDDSSIINQISQRAWDYLYLKINEYLDLGDKFIVSDYINIETLSSSSVYTLYAHTLDEYRVNDFMVLHYDYDGTNYVYLDYDDSSRVANDVAERSGLYSSPYPYIKILYFGAKYSDEITHKGEVKFYLLEKTIEWEDYNLLNQMDYNGKIIHEKQLEDAINEIDIGNYDLLFTFDFQNDRWDSVYRPSTNPPFSNAIIDWYTLSQYKYITILYFENAEILSGGGYKFISSPKTLTITNYDSSYFPDNNNSGIRINLNYTPGYIYNPSSWVRSLYIIYNVGLTTGVCYKVGNSSATAENFLIPYKIYGHNKL